MLKTYKLTLQYMMELLPKILLMKLFWFLRATVTKYFQTGKKKKQKYK